MSMCKGRELVSRPRFEHLCEQGGVMHEGVDLLRRPLTRTWKQSPKLQALFR